MTDKKRTPKLIFRTLPMEVHYPKVHEADQYKPGEPAKYKCRLKAHKDDPIEGYVTVAGDKVTPRRRMSFEDACMQVATMTFGSAKGFRAPINEFNDKDGNPKAGLEDFVWIEPKTGEDYPPAVVDTAGNPLAEGVQVRNGDIVKAIFTVGAMKTPKDRFIVLRLQGVQLVEKRSGGFDASEFDYDDDEDGDVPARKPAPVDRAGTSAANFDDDIPF